MNALIVDDEPLARALLRRMLKAQGVEVAAEAENAARALELAEDLRPDLLFLDIQMPELSGMQAAVALTQLEPAPLLIFVTGFSEHAADAFDHDALDYLLKPVAPERLAKTLMRARERLATQELRRHALDAVAEKATREPPLQRLPVREDYAVRLVRVEQILCAVSRDRRVFLRTVAGEHRTYYTLSQLESMLPTERFLRIHDSCIVNLDHVEELHFLGNHAYEVRLSNRETLPVSRSRYADLQRRMGIVRPERLDIRPD